MNLPLTLLLLCTAYAWHSHPASAQEVKYDRIPWHTPRVSFAPQQRPVRELLKEFAVSQHLPLTVSDAVKGVISGTFMDVETEKFLNTVCEAHDLVWFYDGVRMNVESTDEIVSRPLSLAFVTPDAVNDVLFTIGYVSGPKGREVQVKQGHRSGVLLLVGGPQFVQATETLAKDLDVQEGKRRNEQITVKTFRLNYATAADLSLTTGTTTRVIPGIVRSLQNLMTNQVPGSSLSTGAEETSLRRSHQGLMGQGLAAIGNSNPTRQGAHNPFAPGGDQQRPGGGPEGSQTVDPNDPRAPMIVADVRLNAVLVRDVASRMPLYEDLIKMLDVPTKAIEISAAIVDIDSNNGRDLGMELLGFRKNDHDGLGRVGFDADRGLFDGIDTQGQTPSFADSTNLARGVGLNMTAVFAGAGYELLSRLRAIERTGAGQVLSSPSVFTMENVQAVIRTEEKVYVRVQGNMATDLFDVSTGVELRVTPTLVTEGGRTDFRLIIDIKDGSFSDTKVDSIPATRESAINTQAMVPENKTLLLGGYTVERRSSSDSNVPFLNKIPGLGKLLSRTERNHERRQRFFFITPRLVNVQGEATSPTKYMGEGNPLEIRPRLQEEDLSRVDPEEMARKLAASTTRVEYNPYPEVRPALPSGSSTTVGSDGRYYAPPEKAEKQPEQLAPKKTRQREPLFNRWFRKS